MEILFISRLEILEFVASGVMGAQLKKEKYLCFLSNLKKYDRSDSLFSILN